MKPLLPAHQRGTATGYSYSGRILLTVTAAGAASPDQVIVMILRETAPSAPMAGESLAEYAAVVARRAGLEIARWELTGRGREDSPDDFDPDLIY